jgi:hypothetical protein
MGKHSQASQILDDSRKSDAVETKQENKQAGDNVAVTAVRKERLCERTIAVDRTSGVRASP